MGRFHNQLSSARWERTRRAVFERDGYRCKRCGKAGFLECDHIQPVSEGGEFWDLPNLQPLCHNCHRAKTMGDLGRAPDPEREKWRNYLETMPDLSA